MQELETLRSEKADFETLRTSLDDLSSLLAMEGFTEEDQAAAEKEVAALQEKLDAWEWKTLLGGEHDMRSVLLTIRSGAGGVDAQDWAEILLRMYLRYAERQGFATKVLDEARGGEAGIKSATIEIDGAYAYGYLRGEAGIHRLVRLSPFNANNLRQTSFASVEIMPVVDDDTAIEIRPEDLRIDTYRASGAGGQHVNKTESAVRITHIPTGLVAASQSERSQLQNREEAMKMLRSKVLQERIEEQEREKQKLRGEYKSAEWGNQIRSYVLHPYTLVKDHRTGTETSDAQKVLDGDLQPFIESELRYFSKN
ncbi:MAG: peptide chain release factor 2 [Candidatus Moranbacteria bacterium RIFCSPHIGHO2_01_FULL_55_24]|nr:MAG: peptide chain release factor 2 [Candidatus Moranbacteria bacterium RIFCSPHIGHO2_01_FULL_55_24]